MATDGHEIAIPLITDPSSAGVSTRSKAASYFALTKPRIIELLLITTVPSMVLAAGRWPGLWPVLATLIGGSLSAGGANALNNYVDRDIDEIMKRTVRGLSPGTRCPHPTRWCSGSHSVSPGSPGCGSPPTFSPPQ